MIDTLDVALALVDWTTMTTNTGWRLQRFRNHVCKNNRERNPWPWDFDCPGCMTDIEYVAKKLHLEIPLLLFGPQCVEDSYIRYLRIRKERQDSLHIGAYI